MTDNDDGTKLKKLQGGRRPGKQAKHSGGSHDRQAAPDAISHAKEDDHTMSESGNGEELHIDAGRTDSAPGDEVYEQASAGLKEPAVHGYRSVPHAIVGMLNHHSEKVRIEAIESLLKIGEKSFGDAFVRAMEDESFRVRLGALRGLYKCGGDMVAEQLIKALQDPHPDVRRRSLIYLGWMRKKDLVPYIAGALADTSALVRKVATYALGDIKDFSSVPYLIKALDDRDQEVVKGALAALKRITGKSYQSGKESPEAVQQDIVTQWRAWWETESNT
jgi:HEAT repeat protein